MRFCTIGGLVALLTVTAAAAQNLPAPMSTDRGRTPTAPAKPSSAAKKPYTPKAPSVVTVANASTQTATMVIITAEDATASTSKPLAPKATTTLKLPKLQGCIVSVSARFEGGGQVDIDEFDVCKEKTIRFTE
ncbi:MAG: hypothetical protein ABW003_04550 [Microvirga sp.]